MDVGEGQEGRVVPDEAAGTGAIAAGRRSADGHERDDAFVKLLRAGDPSAYGLLFDTWADPVYDRISHRGFTTADVSDLSTETFEVTHRRLVQQGSEDSFRVLLFRTARQEMLAAEDRRVDLRLPVGPYAEDRLARGADARGLATDAAVASLLWESADVLGEQNREVLDLHHRHGLSTDEIATVLNEPLSSVEETLRKLPIGFGAVVRAKVVWRQGNPSHDELARELDGVTIFDTSTVRAIAEHQRACDTCREAAVLPIDPIDVFAAIPIAAAPHGWKEGVVQRLADSGVPMAGSASHRAVTAPSAGTVSEDVAPTPSSPAQPPPARKTWAAAAAGIAAGSAAAAGTASAASTSAPARTPGAMAAAPAVAPQPSPAPPAPGASGPASSGLTIAPLPPAPEPGERKLAPLPPPKEPSDASGRKVLIGAIAGGALLILIAVVALTRGGGGSNTAKLTASGSNGPVITADPNATGPTAPPMSQVSTESTQAPVDTAAPTDTLATTDSTSAPGSVPGPSSAPAPAPAPANQVTTTTQVPFPNVNLSFKVAPQASPTNWLMTSGSAPHLVWNVTADKPVTVSVTGPGFSSSDASGDVAVCPVSPSGSNCPADVGQYVYRLTVTDSLGRTVRTETRLLYVSSS